MSATVASSTKLSAEGQPLFRLSFGDDVRVEGPRFAAVFRPDSAIHSARVLELSLREVRGRAEVTADPKLQYLFIAVEAPAESTRDWALAYNVMETERLVQHFDGFRFASFLAGDDARTFVELVCWESTEQFRRAFATAAFQEHITVIHHWCTTDVTPVRLVEVTL